MILCKSLGLQLGLQLHRRWQRRTRWLFTIFLQGLLCKSLGLLCNFYFSTCSSCKLFLPLFNISRFPGPSGPLWLKKKWYDSILTNWFRTGHVWMPLESVPESKKNGCNQPITSLMLPEGVRYLWCYAWQTSSFSSSRQDLKSVGWSSRSFTILGQAKWFLSRNIFFGEWTSTVPSHIVRKLSGNCWPGLERSWN
jgi:hypothetical protein